MAYVLGGVRIEISNGVAVKQKYTQGIACAEWTVYIQAIFGIVSILSIVFELSRTHAVVALCRNLPRFNLLSLVANFSFENELRKSGVFAIFEVNGEDWSCSILFGVNTINSDAFKGAVV